MIAGFALREIGAYHTDNLGMYSQVQAASSVHYAFRIRCLHSLTRRI